MTSWGSNEIERGQTKYMSTRGLGRLSFGFGFERSKASAGCDGLWAIIFVLVGGFVMKMGYPILLVPDTLCECYLGMKPHFGLWRRIFCLNLNKDGNGSVQRIGVAAIQLHNNLKL
jgi:hypothetical protein